MKKNEYTITLSIQPHYTTMEQPLIYQDRWVNAQEQHRLYPDTFYAPPMETLHLLEENDTVKICNGYERFWVIITHFYDEFVIGKVSNQLIGEQMYNLDDYVIFKLEHVYDYHTKEEREIPTIQ